LIAIILFILYFLLFLFALKKNPFFRKSGISFNWLSLLFSFKILASILLVLIYTYYYTDRSKADIYKYFDDGNTIYQSLFEHPKSFLKIFTGIRLERTNEEINNILIKTHHFDKSGAGYFESNNHLIIRTNIFFRFFSLGNIYIHALFFAMLSFIGILSVYKAFLSYFDKFPQILYLPLFLVPSVLFWGSGMLKETLLFFFLGILIQSSFKILDFNSVFLNGFIALLSFIFIWQLKPFIALSFIVSFYLMAVINFKGYWRIIVSLIASIGLLLFLYSHHTFFCEIVTSIILKRNEFITLGLQVNAGSLFEKSLLPLDCSQIWNLLPQAFLNTFYHPFILDTGGSLFEKLFAIENTLLLLCIVYLAFKVQILKGRKLQLFIFCISFSLMNYLIIGLSVPILGAIVRYKVIALPFLLVSLLTLVNLNKIKCDIKLLVPFKK